MIVSVKNRMDQFSRYRRVLQTTRIFLFGIFVLTLGWLAADYAVVTGQRHLRYEIGGEQSPLIRNFASKEDDELIGTIKDKEEFYQLITEEPVYFDVHTSRVFPKATVTLTYQNPDGQPTIDLGVIQKDGSVYRKNLGVFNATLENLPVYWDHVREGNVLFAQKNEAVRERLSRLAVIEQERAALEERERTYAAVLDSGDTSIGGGPNEVVSELDRIRSQLEVLRREEESTNDWLAYEKPSPRYDGLGAFLANAKQDERIAVYDYELPELRVFPDYQPALDRTEITKGIRGAHEIYTYVRDEPLDFTFTIQDINRHARADDFSIVVYRGPEQLLSMPVSDDGVSVASGTASARRDISVFIPEPAEGVYRISIESRFDEIFIRKISTRQHWVVFADHLYLTDNEEYRDAMPDIVESATTVYSSGTNYQFRTAHRAGLQTVRVESDEVVLADPHEPVSYSSEDRSDRELQRIVVPKNDVYLQTDGFFAFTEQQMFDPRFSASASALTNGGIPLDDFDYLIARYPEPVREGDWLVARQTVEVPALSTHEDNTIRFFIGLPGLAEADRLFKIKAIDVLLERSPLTPSNIIPRLKAYFAK